jgi:hypothetical protein
MRKMVTVAAVAAAAGVTGKARIRRQGGEETGFWLLLLPSRWKNLLP